MYKTSKWIPITVLFLILLLLGLLLFATLSGQAQANGDQGSASSTSSTSTSSSAEPSNSSSIVTEPSGQIPNDNHTTEEPSTTPPPTIDLTAKYPLFDKTGKQIGEVTIEEYLCGALLGSISFTYDPVALAAQAIALRTATYHRIASGDTLSTETFGYIDHASLLPTWGKDFADTIWQRADHAVSSTKGQVLMYNNALYTFDLTNEEGVLLAETDLGKACKGKTLAEVLTIYYPSATLLQNF